MDITYTLGLLLFFLLIRNSMLTDTLDIEDYVYDEYDYKENYYDFNSTETEAPITKTTTTTTLKPIRTTVKNPTTNVPEVIQMGGMFLDLPKIEVKCPEMCQCNNEFTFVECSKRNIERVPYELPKTVQRLDLSSNNISVLNGNEFANCSNLRELLLDNNKLTSINFKNYPQLIRLEYISLANNHLTEIDSNAFSNLNALKKLNFSNNPIVIASDDDSFLNQPKLEELNMTDCQIQVLNLNTFRNLSGLTALDLSGNDFGEKINTQVFEPLKNLANLKLPELEQDTIAELCKIITTIDLISFHSFKISCYELVMGTSFDESKITAKPENDMQIIAQKPTEDSLKPLPPKDETKVNRNDEKSIPRPNTSIKPRIEKPSMASNHLDVNNTLFNTTSTVNQQKAGEGEDGYQVAISSQTINHILIGIIIVAVTGIIIGIICRRDICGIKTKMCRTRRPPPTDQVRPAEEIPLNKV